jgi:hypothetical protein
VLVQHVEVAVVAYLEDVGSDTHAHGVALAAVEIDDDAHRTSLTRGRWLAEPCRAYRSSKA